MKQLDDEHLLYAYVEALRSNLDDEFIQFLLTEIKRRGIPLDTLSTQNNHPDKSDK